MSRRYAQLITEVVLMSPLREQAPHHTRILTPLPPAKQRAAAELQRVEAASNARAEAAERKAAEATAALAEARRHAAAADAELEAADSEAE
eukprot:713933-Pelagomonas_calceolata.AAC.2